MRGDVVASVMTPALPPHSGRSPLQSGRGPRRARRPTAMPPMSSQHGTYALVLRSDFDASIRIGRLGDLTLRAGYYVYVGSAFGPGGVRARLGHHLRLAPRPHWHVDHLRARTSPVEAWYSHDSTPREHEWSHILSQIPRSSVPLSGFGSSDCSCIAHLLSFARRPSFSDFDRRVRATCRQHGPIHRVRLRMPATAG